jgi:hypothetical protein
VAGLINKERVVFAAAFLWLAWDVTVLVRGSAPLPDVPRKPSYQTPDEPSEAALPVLTANYLPWNFEGRNIFMPRQEFAVLPPAELAVPPAPKANVVSAVPYPNPAAGASGKFRHAVAGAPLDLKARPTPEEDDE